MNKVLQLMLFFGVLVVGFMFLGTVTISIGLSLLTLVVFLIFAVLSWLVVFRFTKRVFVLSLSLLILYLLMLKAPFGSCEQMSFMEQTSSCDCLGFKVEDSSRPEDISGTKCMGYRTACYSYNLSEETPLETEVRCI